MFSMTDAHYDSVDPLNNSSNSLPLLPFHIHIVECTKFSANETEEGRKPIIQWWCVSVVPASMLQIVQKRYCASMSGATAPKLHPRMPLGLYEMVRWDLFIRMPWEDNRGDEVVVGRVIICDSVNLKRRKLKIASTRLTKWGNFPRSRQRFWKTKFTPIPLLWAQIRIGRTASLATWRQEMIEDDYCFRVMVGVWADLSAMYGIEWVESTVKRRKLVIWNSEN